MNKGLLARPSICERCGLEKKIQVHHPDYTTPMIVRWLCKPCHVIEDKTRRMIYPKGFDTSNHSITSLIVWQTKKEKKAAVKIARKIAGNLSAHIQMMFNELQKTSTEKSL